MLATVLDEAGRLLEELVEVERELQVILPYAESAGLIILATFRIRVMVS